MERNFKHTPSFKDMMNDVVAYGSCCECGTCVLVCPHNVIEYIDSKPKQTAKASAAFDFCGISEGIGCDVCAQVCPRLGPREFQLEDAVFAGQQGRVYNGGFGRYQQIFVARAKDPRILERCQDGGVVTAMLIYGMETGFFDGACVSSPDPDNPCAPKPTCETSIEGVLGAAGSWYTYVPNDLALEKAVGAFQGSRLAGGRAPGVCLVHGGGYLTVHAVGCQRVRPIRQDGPAITQT